MEMITFDQMLVLNKLNIHAQHGYDIVMTYMGENVWNSISKASVYYALRKIGRIKVI